MNAAIPASAPPRLLDAFGRHLHYLRLSVTDKCNFRCAYCLPNGCAPGTGAQALGRAELRRLVRAFAELGFWKVRLTGGEPTVRADVVDLVADAAATPGVRLVGLTTNGYRLAAIAPALRDAGLGSLNVSLDSLDPQRFAQVSGRDFMDRVVAGVEAAVAAGIPHVKVNAVLLRGLDDADLERFLSWTRRAPVAVRFIELMETGDNGDFFARHHLPAAEIRARLEARGWTPLPVRAGEGDGPAVRYAHPDHAGTAGVIAPYERGFCDRCNRLRVSSNGDLELCLFGDRRIPLRDLLQDDHQRDALVRRIEAAVAQKPRAHGLREHRFGRIRSLASMGG